MDIKLLEGPMGNVVRAMEKFPNFNQAADTNFQLMQHHKYSLTELEEMMPWEREIYINLLLRHLEEEKEKQKSRK